MKSLKDRILKEIQLAINEIQGREINDLEHSVHAFRRRCKRIRAYIRLLPPSLTKQAERARKQVRQAAATLSGLRDAQVSEQTWHQIDERLRHSETERAAVVDCIQCPKQKPTPVSQSAASELLHSAAKALHKGQRTVKRLPTRQSRSKLLARLRETYQAARRATQVTMDGSSPENYHELRKLVKQFYHQCQFVRSAYHHQLQSDIEQAQNLANKLGDAMDLAVLAANLGCLAPNRDLSRVSAVLHECQLQMESLFKESTFQASRLFFESTKDFARKIT
jgi:CHAD domain-containing protein